MNTLIIDTSSEYCILAIANDERLLAHTLFFHENRLSHSLLPEVASLMQKANLTMKELDRIAVGVGPGSYTGTRVGVATAKSFAYGLNISLRGFCSLAAFLPSRQGSFASVLSAKSGLFYLLKGEKSKDFIRVDHAHLIAREELKKEMQDVDFVTARNKEELSSFPEILEFLTFHPDPENILLTLRSLPQFPFETDAQLIYLHAPQ